MMDYFHLSMYIMAFLYILAGINHFLRPAVYLKMMPPLLPQPALLNYLSGGCEILFGAGLLFPATQSIAAWGIIILLFAIFPANIYMLTSGRFRKIPTWLLWLRLPLQLVLIGWAYLYV